MSRKLVRIKTKQPSFSIKADALIGGVKLSSKEATVIFHGDISREDIVLLVNEILVQADILYPGMCHAIYDYHDSPRDREYILKNLDLQLELNKKESYKFKEEY